MNYVTRYLTLAALCLAGLATIAPAQAGIVITNTRQIYSAKNREQTVKLTNEDKKLPRLVQVWMDSGNEKLSAEKSDAPFLITPPVFRLEPGKSQALRMVYTNDPLPTDKETVFWLNVLEVPPMIDTGDGDSKLRFAFRIRQKVFFRPEGLSLTSFEAPQKLTWSLVKHNGQSFLEVHNPSPYYVSFQSVAVAMSNKPDAEVNKSDDYDMVAPSGTQQFALKKTITALPVGAEVRFSVVNDYGGFSPLISAPLKP
ncbi:molecular chaperone [Collimonas sp. NPDC087041]|uniref:fimbrial biogenesis chaperone n=1 Tax=Collimonas sp. NPDC087041 TaxID=3363960 RepID=UPI00382E0A8C